MKTGAFFSALFVLMAFPVSGEKIPDRFIEALGSEEFKVREASQQSVLDWAKKKKGGANSELLRLSKESEDPEIRQRCSEILRTLSDEDYLSDGKGYLGINMVEEAIEAAEGEEKRFGIRVMDVMRGSPAEKGELKRGDLIIGLDGESWDKAGAVDIFMGAIAKMKPLTEITVLVKRDEADPLEFKIPLGKSPIPDLRAARGNLQMLDEHARDRHFNDWLKNQELKPD